MSLSDAQVDAHIARMIEAHEVTIVDAQVRQVSLGVELAAATDPALVAALRDQIKALEADVTTRTAIITSLATIGGKAESGKVLRNRAKAAVASTTVTPA